MRHQTSMEVMTEEQQPIIDSLEAWRIDHATSMRRPWLSELVRVLALGYVGEGFRRQGWPALQWRIGRLYILFVLQDRDCLRDARTRERRSRPYRQ